MKEPQINDDLSPLTERGISDLRAVTSEIAPPEPAGPAPLVGTGEMVGLRVESAEALARSWQSRAEELRVRASEHRNHGRGFAALKNDERADTLYDCVNELRRQAGLSIPRQPEPNDRDVPTSGTNGESKP